MDKLRAAFGLSEDVKEGQAFDRELQEQLKQERIAAKEQQQRQKEKEDKKRRKARRRRKRQGRRRKDGKQRKPRSKPSLKQRYLSLLPLTEQD